MAFCIICAAPRSGTTFLGRAVCDVYEIQNAGEIFYEVLDKGNPDILDKSHPEIQSAEDWWLAKFFRFRSGAIRERPELIFPDDTGRHLLFDLYLDHLRNTFRSNHLLLDIKYTSWHHFDGFWRYPTDPPGLIELIREKQIPVVHLIRENLFALYCSMQMAMRDRIWEIPLSGAVGEIDQMRKNTRTLRVQLSHCHDWMTNMASVQQRFAKWLNGLPVYTLTYEGLLDNGLFSKNVSDVFTKALGCPPVHEWTVKFAKILPPLERVVENAREVMDYFAGTQFEKFVKASLEGER